MVFFFKYLFLPLVEEGKSLLAAFPKYFPTFDETAFQRKMGERN